MGLCPREAHEEASLLSAERNPHWGSLGGVGSERSEGPSGASEPREGFFSSFGRCLHTSIRLRKIRHWAAHV